ncbi:MAG: ABC transporter permease subunit [Mariprofundales bacterium]|nr:ABC transporter permease subunit [Mariprofundales bacterium]
MRAVWILCGKELRVTLDTAQGAVVAVAFLLATGFFFGSNLFLIGQAEMRGFFSVMPLLLMFFIPAMAMRQLADELNQGTFELLATMPISTWQLVMGKYLAILLQLLMLFALTLLYPASLALLGNPDGGAIAAGFLALMLLASAYSAVCLYASALTRHAIIAYIIGFSLLFAMFLLNKMAATLPPATQDWLTILLPFPPFNALLRGVIGLEQVVYFVSFSIFFLALTCFQLERRRWR